MVHQFVAQPRVEFPALGGYIGGDNPVRQVQRSRIFNHLLLATDKVEVVDVAVQGVAVVELDVAALGNRPVMLLPHEPVLEVEKVRLGYLYLDVTIHIHPFMAYRLVIPYPRPLFESRYLGTLDGLGGHILCLFPTFILRSRAFFEVARTSRVVGVGHALGGCSAHKFRVFS